MINPFVIAAAASAAAAIAADWEERRHGSFYALKPLTTLLIIGLAVTLPGSASPLYRELVIAGLVLSTAGDVCLMFRGPRWFVAGLSSFLVAHLLFAAAFLDGVPGFSMPWYAWIVVPYGAVSLWILLPRAGALRIPVLVYCAVITAMVVTAAARYHGLGGAGPLNALTGAVLFLMSDSLLGARQFVGRYRGAQALILSTYWAGVGFIAASV